MKTFIKLTFVTAIFAFIFSCSTPETEVFPSESIDIEYTKKSESDDTAYSKMSKSDLVEKTKAYFSAIEKNVRSEEDLAYAEELTDELIGEWAKVLEEEGGIEEAQNALKTLEQSYKMLNQSKQGKDCARQFVGCAIGHLTRLVAHVVGGGNQNVGILEAAIGLLGCLQDYVNCAL